MVPSDRELIQQTQRGDMVAFEQLVHRYDQQVLSMSAKYVNDPNDAKDIYQEVFLRAYKGLPRFQFRSEFSTWLYRITTNVCLTFRSRSTRRSLISLDEKTDEQWTTMTHTLADNAVTDEQAVRSDIALHVEDAMDALSPKQKLVFTLRHFEGYKLKEIASMMDCAEGTVKKYLFTATQKMRAQLEGLWD